MYLISQSFEYFYSTLALPWNLLVFSDMQMTNKLPMYWFQNVSKTFIKKLYKKFYFERNIFAGIYYKTIISKLANIKINVL